MSGNLSGPEMRAALDTLHAVGQDCLDSGDFARRGVQCLPRLVSSELTTLSTSRSQKLNPPLTARERDVLDWLGAGKTDKDIAAILAIRPRTVQKHLQRIYEKLGVETRTAAVMRALNATRH